ncbi:MAG: anhydro-N-acetylmuramic acid kinase [Alphaproteobacteria bacterium]|nr:anhydro-N-acetylmuramic acid kinase [Alphaproteobacteria bacterium]
MLCIGIMTGNSLDAVDAVLTHFEHDKITDICTHSTPYPQQLRADFLTLKAYLSAGMDMKTFCKTQLFQQTHDTYIQLVANTVLELIQQNGIEKSTIQAIGFHGQTIDYCGPSVAKKSGIKPYNTQMGSGQMLSNLTGLPVIYDFRSDDVMTGGEGAPLAPTHNLNLARTLNIESAIFFNAGNTSNLSIVADNQVLGWDAGPFNELTDKMMQLHKNKPFDENGTYGLKGQLNPDLLNKLFEYSATTGGGENYLTLPPPKASDPRWYRFLDELKDPTNFNDKLHTVQYFAAYTAAYTLKFVPSTIQMPTNFILFGGGWNNPVCRMTFENILNGTSFILPHHTTDFKEILSRFESTPQIWISNMGKYMEARIFADLAHYYLKNRPWFENVAGHTPIRLGRMRYPNESVINDMISRSSKGWQEELLFNTTTKVE